MEDVYNLFGLGGPDLDPYQSTSTFLTVEDSEMMEKIIEEHLCLESLGEEAQLVYFTRDHLVAEHDRARDDAIYALMTRSALTAARSPLTGLCGAQH